MGCGRAVGEAAGSPGRRGVVFLKGPMLHEQGRIGGDVQGLAHLQATSGAAQICTFCQQL